MDTMDTETITMNGQKKIPGTGRGTGRALGSKNKLPALGKNFREVLRNMMFIDDESVERLKRIDGRAVAARERIWQTLHGIRPASTAEFLAVMKFCADYGIGTPVKMTGDVVQRPPLVFASQSGYVPYDSRHPSNIPIDERSRRFNIENDQKLAIEAAERKAQIEVEPAKADSDAETLELVREQPEVFERGR